jgi:hypothetical protein
MFGPSEGAGFFAQHGWDSKDVQGLLKTASQFKLSPVELLSLLPDPKGAPGIFLGQACACSTELRARRARKPASI